MKKFNSVVIGRQEWLATNLNTRKFRNGDPVPVITNEGDWATASAKQLPACCFFENMQWIGRNYGKLYNWYAVNDPRGLAPNGWHIPVDNEWEQMINVLGGSENAGIRLKSKKEWDWNGFGTNESKFNALPGCYRDSHGVFRGFEDDGLWWKDDGYWWSSTVLKDDAAWLFNLNCNSGHVYRYAFLKGCGISVRCVKDIPV